jgi:threonine/homoserine/homoserine lactone efflux protein
VLGNATWRTILGILALFVVQMSAPTLANRGIVMPVWLAVVLSATLIFMGTWLISRKPKTDETAPDELPKWLVTMKKLPPWASFGYGFYNCMLPGAQWVYFLGGIAVISAAGLPESEQIILLLVFVTLLQVMLVTPIVIYIRRRERAQAQFEKLHRWLGKHASTVFGGILVMIGGFFAIIALMGGKVGGR